MCEQQIIIIQSLRPCENHSCDLHSNNSEVAFFRNLLHYDFLFKMPFLSFSKLRYNIVFVSGAYHSDLILVYMMKRSTISLVNLGHHTLLQTSFFLRKRTFRIYSLSTFHSSPLFLTWTPVCVSVFPKAPERCPLGVSHALISKAPLFKTNPTARAPPHLGSHN